MDAADGYQWDNSTVDDTIVNSLTALYQYADYVESQGWTTAPRSESSNGNREDG